MQTEYLVVCVPLASSEEARDAGESFMNRRIMERVNGEQEDPRLAGYRRSYAAQGAELEEVQEALGIATVTLEVLRKRYDQLQWVCLLLWGVVVIGVCIWLKR